MKRVRDDIYAGSGSQFKRPFSSSRGDSYGPTQVPGGGGGGGSVGGGATTSQKLGHNNLIFGFNTFLPKGYEITLDDDEAPPKKKVEFEEAISFVNKIKKRFQSDEEHVYKSFLGILNMYSKEHKDIGEVYSEVATLFKDHRYLLEEFTRFLPDTSAAPSTQHAPYARNSLQRFSERSSMQPMMRQMQVDKTQRYRRERLPSRDLSVEQHPEMDDDKTMMNMHKEQRKRKRESKDRRINRDQDEREPDHINAQQFLERFLEKKKSVKKAEGFGLASDFSSNEDKDTLKNMYSRAFSFCEKVKEKLNSADDYLAFLKCLHICIGGIIKRNDLQNLVTELLGKHPDLMEEFNDFLERCENIGDKEQKGEIDGAKDKEKERYREKKYMGKSIQELDLSDCKRCTPSYRLLPADYPIPTASQRSELDAQVLNDHWVSVTSGSEDYSFKHVGRMNQYEEILFRCEDDRFELDMLLESVSSAAKRAEELYNNMNENKINMETLNRIEDYFTVQNLRCIERVYGDHGLEVIDILRKNPTRALPVILTRLKQKQEEWSRCRSDFNKVWAEIYSKIHYKSLKEKQQKEDDILQSTIAAGNKLVRYSCEEVLSSKEVLNKIMRLYSTFLEEPMLGVPSQSHGTERAAEEDRKAGHNNVGNFVAPNIVGDGSTNGNGDSIPINPRLPKSDKNEADGRVTEVKNVHRTSVAASDKENGPVGGELVSRVDDPLMEKAQKKCRMK